MDTITLKEATKMLYSGDPIDIRYVTCDFSRNKGGDIREYRQARFNTSHDTDSTIVSSTPKKIKPQPIDINIILQSGEIRTLYKAGITHINEKQILI